jgi:hypothetical protein
MLSPNYYLDKIEPGLTIPKLFVSTSERFEDKGISMIPDFVWIIMSFILLALVSTLFFLLVKN